jgi:HD-GYP domain-containing protein (c-di-GMP phosphodiesterase class II)
MRRLLGLNRIDAYVAAISVVTAASLVLAWLTRGAFPGIWPIAVFSLIAVLLEASVTKLRGGGGEGSLAFLVHFAAMLLFGGIWAAAIAGLSTFVVQLITGRPLNKTVFNTSQQFLCLLAAYWVYSALGGANPPTIIQPGVAASFTDSSRTILAFLASGVAYFGANSLMVSGAVAISTGRPFGAVWKTNTLWVLGYDVASSFLGMLLAWLYLVFDDPTGMKRFGFIAVLAPIILIRHVYAKLNVLQNLYDQLDTAHDRLETNVREQLAMMVKSIEARDPYTSGHSMRVAAVSKAIAIDFGLSDDLVEEVENAALLHDVGKIHAEFAPLLQKEGKLTPEEWEIMKTHSVKSAELVGLFSRFKGHVQDAVRHHHERWDGLGYADGIAAEAIPLGARIIMIADTIDAMTTDRPYRKALGFDAVVAELLKHRATQFDPRLVDCAVSSVTIRRMIAEPNLGVSSVDVGLQIVQSAPLRSYDSFFLGRRRS